MKEKYRRVLEELAELGTSSMKVFGQSMMPMIESGSVATYHVDDDYEIGDVVFCKVPGRKGSRWIGAHKITKKAADGRFMISNNKGHDNGWTRHIYGRVTAINGEPFGRPLNVS